MSVLDFPQYLLSGEKTAPGGAKWGLALLMQPARPLPT
jgi:hypothetical protein